MNKKYDYNKIEKTTNPHDHITNGGQGENLNNVKVGKNHKYKITNPLTYIASFFLWLLAYAIVPVILFFRHGLIVKGRRNLKGLKTGAVSISNHCLVLDSAIVAMALFPRKPRFQTIESNFQKPIKTLLTLLNCMPIPTQITAQPNYMKATQEILESGKILHLNPEASMWPYYDKIRAFKPGAFHFAAKANVPIIPISINFRKAKGITKFFKIKDRLVTVHVGKPIYSNEELPFRESVRDLMEKSHYNLTRMNKYYKWIDGEHAKDLQPEDVQELAR